MGAVEGGARLFHPKTITSLKGTVGRSVAGTFDEEAKEKLMDGTGPVSGKRTKANRPRLKFIYRFRGEIAPRVEEMTEIQMEARRRSHQ